MAWRYMEKDFRMRSTYGAVEGSVLEDWPIAYSDLETYYEKAEWEMGVSGDDANNIFKAPRKRPLPMPPLPPGREHQILLPAARRLGLHPFDIPMLRNTVPYNGRRSCMRCRWCVGFACEVNARTGTHNTVIPAALATAATARSTPRGSPARTAPPMRASSWTRSTTRGTCRWTTVCAATGCISKAASATWWFP
jgi:choline dehydrogenase-like flavoprotein